MLSEAQGKMNCRQPEAKLKLTVFKIDDELKINHETLSQLAASKCIFSLTANW